MKFITEDVLRDLYKKCPFTTYEMEDGTRLTPGGRQFLLDRGIDLYSGAQKKKDEESSESERIILHCARKLKTLEAQFFVTGQEMIGLDISMAQELISMGRTVARSYTQPDCESGGSSLGCHPCTGMNQEHIPKNMEDCFEISDFHIQSPRGREIVLLHRLRCMVREVQLELKLSGREVEGEVLLHETVNRLSQLICITFGGKECQKKG